LAAVVCGCGWVGGRGVGGVVHGRRSGCGSGRVVVWRLQEGGAGQGAQHSGLGVLAHWTHYMWTAGTAYLTPSLSYAPVPAALPLPVSPCSPCTPHPPRPLSPHTPSHPPSSPHPHPVPPPLQPPTSVSSTLTRAPITPRLVRRRYSKGRVLDTVLRKGYRNSGTWAAGWEGRCRRRRRE
jgi:hypothetical protein